MNTRNEKIYVRVPELDWLLISQYSKHYRVKNGDIISKALEFFSMAHVRGEVGEVQKNYKRNRAENDLR